VSLLLSYGEQRRARGAATKYVLSKRSIQEISEELEPGERLEGSATKLYAVVSSNRSIITVGYLRRTRRRRR
jgi:hypothetical protein